MQTRKEEEGQMSESVYKARMEEGKAYGDEHIGSEVRKC